MRYIFNSIIVIFLIVPQVVLSNTSHSADEHKTAIVITSETLEGDSKKDVLIFEGHVIVKRGDVTLYSDMIQVNLDRKEKKINEIRAEGNVKIVQGERIATGDRAIFNNDTNIFTLTGTPKVWQGNDIIKGSEITYYIDEEKVIVKGAKENRVQMLVYPEGKKSLRSLQ
ncbi:MAG: lipopolysaccharide transport periplasmic protein LptA [Thermodesulfobacteriota bacterium]|nr:lipopolysaccharide transport periplasmic protein LptA [Thermodesulfobacteriota bacterium]